MTERFLDIEDAVTVWANMEYDKTATKFQKKLKSKEIKTGSKILQLLIDWSQVKLESETSWSELEDVVNQPSSSSDAPVINSLVPAETLKAITLNKPSASVLFQTRLFLFKYIIVQLAITKLFKDRENL